MLSSDMLAILFPALAAGMLVLLTHVPLGREVLRRGVIFIDLAIAQIAALGAVVASLLLPDKGGTWLAFGFALIAAHFFRVTERRHAQYQEAIIGAAFITASALSLLLLAHGPHGSEEIQHMLAGQMLWVSWEAIGLAAIISLPLLLVWHTQERAAPYFYYIFSVIITLSVQMVGVYLVFACLIMPALAVVHLQKRPLLTAYGIGGAALVSGLLVSLWADLPTGPVLVCSLAVFCCVSFIATQRYSARK